MLWKTLPEAQRTQGIETGALKVTKEPLSEKIIYGWMQHRGAISGRIGWISRWGEVKSTNTLTDIFVILLS